MTWGGTTPGQNGSIGSVELRGFEPLTPSMPCMPVPSDAIGLGRITAGQRDISVWLRRAPSAMI